MEEATKGLGSELNRGIRLMVFSKNARGFDVPLCPDYAKIALISSILDHFGA
jgi:hypothetical protein